ncbi:M23 family metallopeptidase [Chryseobacterium sp. PS-8]|uniref:M23 family metallopeptidase n=1 Tax=Chryseobacterium indicum TaxID=2766954 RepID=A0ABS9C4N3_9FLAO|nr:M23 family metallopeptidase [Chryseobacterium sp. PS-8]MCF2218743.1 M23 family metallopeptidase [Chryseobacterium sp. PS-8]
MKTIEKYFIAVLILSFQITIFGQFNTLTPTLPKKTESAKAIEQVKETDNPKLKKERKSWKDFFNITSKAKLKNELDSLKAILKENSSANNKKWDRQKMQDSLILVAQTKMLIHSQNGKNQLTQYDFVNKPREKNFSKIVMPLNREISITSPYGTRMHPIFGASKFHNGIDLAANYENVYSVLDGIVTETGWDNNGGGNYIKVNHFNRFETAYLHLSEIYYRVGEFIKAGFIIAKSGNSGNSTGPHLHFSVKEFGQNINPTHFLNDLIKVNQLIATHYAK